MINLLRDVLLDSELICGDETTFQVLKEPGRRPQSKSYMGTDQRFGTASADVLVLSRTRSAARAASLCRHKTRCRVDDRRL
ncbi:IS66 family transposase [Paraburkholderia aspalathi]|uniref:IS66 family transposase n=1 Tax=Paraburkholderia aspalathi TaxID=1324617 RepID=UPI0038B85216